MAKRIEVYYGLEGHTNDTMLLAPQAAFYAALFRDACAQPAVRLANRTPASAYAGRSVGRTSRAPPG